MWISEQYVVYDHLPALVKIFIAWEPEKNGQLTAQSAYWLAAEELSTPSLASSCSAPDKSREVCKLIWSCLAPPKVLSCDWHVATNALATWTNKKEQLLRYMEPSLWNRGGRQLSCALCLRQRPSTLAHNVRSLGPSRDYKNIVPRC